MTQAGLFSGPAPSPVQRARSERDRVLAELERKAGAAFRQRAADCILAELAQWGDLGSSGERLVSVCREAGIEPVKGDDRAFGPVFGALSKRRQIVKIRSVPRLRGNLTSGGNLWALASALRGEA